MKRGGGARARAVVGLVWRSCGRVRARGAAALRSARGVRRAACGPPGGVQVTEAGTGLAGERKRGRRRKPIQRGYEKQGGRGPGAGCGANGPRASCGRPPGRPSLRGGSSRAGPRGRGRAPCARARVKAPAGKTRRPGGIGSLMSPKEAYVQQRRRPRKRAGRAAGSSQHLIIETPRQAIGRCRRRRRQECPRGARRRCWAGAATLAAALLLFGAAPPQGGGLLPRTSMWGRTWQGGGGDARGER